MLSLDFEKMLIEHLRWSQRHFRRLSYVTLVCLMMAFVSTFYLMYSFSVEYLIGVCVLWVLGGVLRILFCSISHRDGVYASRLESGKYKRMIGECFAVHISDTDDSTFEVRVDDERYLLLGPTELAIGLVPIFDIPNHSSVYLMIVDIDGWKRVLGRHLIPYSHTMSCPFERRKSLKM